MKKLLNYLLFLIIILIILWGATALRNRNTTIVPEVTDTGIKDALLACDVAEVRSWGEHLWEIKCK